MASGRPHFDEFNGALAERAGFGSAAGAANCRGCRRPAFSLIEIMVVLAIIALLIGLLVPVLASARRKGRENDTRAELNSLRAACEGYFALFADFPGPISEADLAKDTGFSGAQNLTLGILGSMYDAGGSNAPQSISGTSGGAFGTLPLPPKPDGKYQLYGATEPRGIYDAGEKVWHAALYTPRGGELTVARGVRMPANALIYSGATPAICQIPVLHDRYADPLPVLYFRRISATLTPVLYTDTVANVNNGSVPQAAYLRAANIGYLDSTTLASPSDRLCPQLGSGASGQLQTLLTDPGADRARGAFVLLSAGEDRIYGTTDDMVVSGGN